MFAELIFGLICLVLGFVLLAGTFLSPLLTFLILFTTLGNALHRALRGKPLRTAYRFDLRALIVLITFTAVSIGWLKAAYNRPPTWQDWNASEFGDASAVDIRGNHDPWVYVANWLVIALPVSMLLAATRYALDLYDDRGRPTSEMKSPPPTFDFLPPPDPPQDSPAPGE